MTAPKDVMEALHVAVASDLLAKIQSGEASAAELSAAIKFLKDNGIEALPAEGSPLGNLVDSLPFNVEPLRRAG
jgi:hypothetical protein